MPAEILPFTARDIPEALELWRRSEGIGLFGETPERLAGCLDRNPELSFVAREGGALVGAVLCTFDGRRGFLHHLAVAPTHRRRQIGERLAAACLTGLERLGSPRCHLFVHRGNREALAFWTRAGWSERSDVIMMSRDLAPGG
jgi:ribosomal protein S18 acetylase RimI-like enzyme